MEKDIKTLVVVEWIFLLIGGAASLLFLVLTTYASALIHGGKKISIKNLVSRTIRSFKGPLVTCFYSIIFDFGYLCLCLVTLLPFELILGVGDDGQVTSSPSTILLSIPAAVFYTYLTVVWNLAFVISVVEEKYGIEALGKAAQIVKGMKLQGFILNLLLTILSLILLQCFRLMNSNHSQVIGIVIAMLVPSSIHMVNMFWCTAYTVLYYRCKTTNGGDIALEAADMEYNKLLTAPLIKENIP
ncbi:hypothetical protein PTKIN_Ptkin03bG0135500 [Pterospermum kingtungense]